MNKLTKAQRDQLISIVIGVVVLSGALYYFGVTAMNHDLIVTHNKTQDMRKKLADAETLMRREAEISDTLHARAAVLASREEGMAPDRDTYAWMINKLNNFMQGRKGISIDACSQPDISDDGPFPRFPYRWALFHIRGTGYYHDIGKFFADLENGFPYFRIQSPIISANSGPGMEPEKLTVTFDLLTPVKAISPETK